MCENGSDLDGLSNVEWQYKADHMPWHPWTRERTLLVDDDWLRIQAEHTIYVRSRIVGEPFTLDPTPAEIRFRVDALPPAIRLEETAQGEVDIHVRDMVSPPKNTGW